MDERQKTILDFVKSMVHDVDKHEIVFNLIKHRIDDIITECEDLALMIETGKFYVGAGRQSKKNNETMV